jgi:hypothetical protein
MTVGIPSFAARAAAVRARRLVLGTLAAAAACGGGGDGTSPDPASGRAALTLRAVIEAASATAVELRVGYLEADGTRVELSTQTVPLPGAATPPAAPSQTTMPQTTLPIDVGRCIADGRRAVPGPACSVVVVLRLLRGATTLDEQSITASVPPGAALTLQAPAPLYEVQGVRIAVGDSAATSARLEIGDTLRLSAASVDATGATVAGRPIVWASDASLIARIDQAGVVVGIGPGTATIQAISGGRSATTRLTVVPVTVRTIGVAPSPVQLAVGATAQLTATPRDAHGTALADRLVTFTSSDRAVATVSPSGEVRGVAGGSATITVASPDGPNGIAVRTEVPVTVTGETGRAVVNGRLVVGATNAPVADATLRFERGGATAATATSDADGAWSASGLLAGTYAVSITAPGLRSTAIPALVVSGTVAVPTIPLTLAQPAAPGNVQVTLRDATTGAPISVPVTLTVGGGVALTSSAVDALASKTTLTTSTGGVLVPALANTATLRAQAAGYADALVLVAPVAGQTTATTIALSPIGGVPAQTRIVLTWGADPIDLDAHLTGPTPAGRRFHIFWALPGDCEASPFACLDVDETSGSGPETISIAQGFAGTYHYAVNLFHGPGTLATSGARVDLYIDGVLARSFTPPAGTGAWWNVFDIVDGEVVLVNTYSPTAPSVIFAPGSVMPVKGVARP